MEEGNPLMEKPLLDTTKFSVLAHCITDKENVLILRLNLGTVSEDTLRHIELEAKDSANELLTPLKQIIDEIVAKDENKQRYGSYNPEDDVCEACQ
ncbi:hypothetical protein [Candidatus Liberibacter africanus]|uniref:Uncharacterized protein n=2 Tax=Liberibacter africanus TaxID=34020 RepID=A0A0G3I6G0_LIBAF|nr:hypothetical protein [Candidatus Liberibacter africanus]AKK20083.1 hypothetical protein G293_02255 [Candidatus Liberibacter africanus PTSAPSY]